MTRTSGKRYPEIGDRLRAYRIGTNRSIDDVARRLGVSRAAVYRYEQGEVVKIETIARLGKLLGVPLIELLGVEIEFISNGVAFFERLRQIEEHALSTVVVYGPIAYVLTSPEYDDILERVLTETFAAEEASSAAKVKSLMDTLLRRKSNFLSRKSGIVSISSVNEIERFLTTGLVSRTGVTAALSAERRAHAVREVRHIANMVRHPPMGVQIGLLTSGLPISGFQIIRQAERSLVVTSPFRIGDLPNVRVGVASINDMGHVVQLHEGIANEMWTEALVGESAARHLEALADKAEENLR